MNPDVFKWFKFEKTFGLHGLYKTITHLIGRDFNQSERYEVNQPYKNYQNNN